MRYLCCLFSLFLSLIVVGATQAQEATPVEIVNILGVDSSAFPDVTLSFTAQDALGNGLDTFPALQLFESERLVADADLSTVDAGVAVTFVIDANRTINNIDLIGDVPRVAKVRTAIANFANQFVSRNGTDRVSVIVPDGESARFLFEDVSVPDDIVAGIGAYDAPETPPSAAPVQAMLELAFVQAAEREPTNQYQAIILLSDTEFLREQVDYFILRDIAAESDVVFFGAILGKVASAAEISNMTELTIPTGGYSIHTPEAESLNSVLATVKSNATVNQVRYRSSIASSGEHPLTVAVGAVNAETELIVEVLPPQLQFLLDSAPIERTGEDGVVLDALEPMAISVPVQLTWPDGHARSLSEVRFFVDGLEQVLRQPPVLDPTGLLSFEWQISFLEAGAYGLEVRVIDELGLTAQTNPFSQEIVVTVIEEEPTPTPAPVPTATLSSAETTRQQLNPYLTERNVTLLSFGVVGILLLILLRKLQRRRQAAQFPPTAIIPPQTNLPENVYLQVVGDDDRATLMPVVGEAVAIGSDPFRADIVIDDQSISRFHATIKFENHHFVLYDEGSAYGTKVNFERVGLAPIVIKDGDELEFGSVRANFRIFGSAPTSSDELSAISD